MSVFAQIGSYRIVRTLSVATFREVFLATSSAAVPVVIERILPGFEDSPPMAARVSRATLAYGRLAHPAIVRMLDFLTDEPQPAIVFEAVDGVSLEGLVSHLRARNVVLGLSAVLYVGARMFAAVAAGHAACDPVTERPTPIPHRDLSPANVLIEGTGGVKLGGWGFGDVITKDHDAGTAPGDLAGYMAPEQITGGTVGTRTDLYRGALLLHELLTRAPAFPCAADVSPLDYLQGMARPTLPPLADACPLLPAEVAEALGRALRPEPDERTITAAELRDVLACAVDGVEGRRALIAAVARSAPELVAGMPVQVDGNAAE